MIQLDDFLAANPDASVHGPVFARSFSGYCFDSRIVRPGELFVAVKTSRADGHDYVIDACDGGAAGAIVERPMDLAEHGATCVVVPDTEQAIQGYGRFMLAKLRPKVVAITGSAGKTTTKEAVAHVLGARWKVFRNPGNYSGRFGLPIALGDLEPFHEIAVLEMATDHFGEMALMTGIAPPEVGIVTLVAPAHLAAFGTLDAIAREKGMLVDALPPGGLAILNGDDERVAAMAARSKAPVLRYRVMAGKAIADHGQAERDLLATELRSGPSGTSFTLLASSEEHRLEIPWIGEHMVRAALAATAAGRHFGLTLQEIADRLASLPPVPGRLNLLPGRCGSVVVDDSYNASPEAVLAGLDVLSTLDADTRVAVLGEMAELGEASENEHRRVGHAAAKAAEWLVTKGNPGRWIAEAARESGMAADRVIVTYTPDDAVAAVEPLLASRTAVYVKGSAVARMEQVVAALLAEPETAPEHLVRQDAAWRQIVIVRPDRPTWLEIDHGAIGHNVRHLVDLAGGAKVYAVLKADAYGHGAVQVAHTALLNGAYGCAVACLPEAVVLRRAGIDAPILVLGYTPGWQAREAVAAGVGLAVYDESTARALAAAATALNTTTAVHVKVDTGMHRLGLPPEELPEFVRLIDTLPGLEIEGVFTHFADADDLSERGRASTRRQAEAFDSALRALAAADLRPPIAHAANSAALMLHEGLRYDAVRPGIAIYGLAPSPDRDAGLRPALAWKAQVAQVRDLEPGERVGYGGAWTPSAPARIATLPVGYADGFRRGPRPFRHVLIRGQPAPVVGRVSMDQSAVDVTAIPDARQGDEVVLIGRQGSAEITAEDVAGWLGTINYEVVSAILARVPRVS